jgi:large subunit ribosomal protein L19
MKNPIVQNFEKKSQIQNLIHPKFRPGDTVRVHYKLEEGSKSSGGEKKYRIQAFEGVCIRYKKSDVDSTFSVRKISSNNIGVERNFPLNSPMIERIDLVAAGKVRQARLYYLRDLKGKAARIVTRRLPAGTLMTSVNKDGSETVAKKKKKEKSKKK